MFIIKRMAFLHHACLIREECLFTLKHVEN